MTLLTLRALGPTDREEDTVAGEPPREGEFARPQRSARRGHLYLLPPGR